MPSIVHISLGNIANEASDSPVDRNLLDSTSAETVATNPDFQLAFAATIKSTVESRSVGVGRVRVVAPVSARSETGNV